MPNKNKNTSERLKGMRNGFIYYLIGAVIVILVHYIIGWEYIHAPPASFFVLLIVLLGGIVRLFWNMANIKKENRITANKYELIIHSVPALIGVVLIFMTIFTD